MDGREELMEFEEILFRAKQGEDLAINQILELYQPMLVKHSLVNGQFDEDLYQELVMETLKCIRYFKRLE